MYIAERGPSQRRVQQLRVADPAVELLTDRVTDSVHQFGAVLGRAVVDYGFERYLSIKRITEPSDDPVADVAVGWDNHIAFAREHPTVYRMMYSPSLSAVPKAANEAFELLHGLLERCAEAGQLRVPPGAAAQTIMTASVGVALSLVTQPDMYTDPGLSGRVRDAVFASVFADAPDRPRSATTPATKALQLKAMLDADPGTELVGPEVALLKYWLERLATPS